MKLISEGVQSQSLSPRFVSVFRKVYGTKTEKLLLHTFLSTILTLEKEECIILRLSKPVYF
jgi:hypothetical protein